MGKPGNRDVVDRLLDSVDPSVRFFAHTQILGIPEREPRIIALRDSIAASPRATALLSGRDGDGRIPGGVYRKWQGPHWTLWQLARIGYPPGDPRLLPLRDQVYDWLFAKAHLLFPRSLLIPGQEDRFRHCASWEGNAIWYSLRLGIDDGRPQELAARLAAWQWPDGGWNCDRRPEACCSSATETLMPLRGLTLAARTYADPVAKRAADAAAEWFLSRRLFRRRSDGKMIVPGWGGPFDLIHLPIVFYDLLSVLVVMREAGRLDDPRCGEALDLLEAKRLPDGGFAAEFRSARTSAVVVTGASRADWGTFGKGRMNELVTAEALGVLRAAGRL